MDEPDEQARRSFLGHFELAALLDGGMDRAALRVPCPAGSACASPVVYLVFPAGRDGRTSGLTLDMLDAVSMSVAAYAAGDLGCPKTPVDNAAPVR
jgi:hypothetical protein